MKLRFSQITETPGIGATREQLAMMATRYGLAAHHAGTGPILEVACGTGIGLGLLADAAGSVIGSDIDPDNVRIATDNWADDKRIQVAVGDAAKLTFSDGAFTAVVCFEALYYFPDLPRCIAEMVRVLRPGGKLILCTVNPGWSGFNRSPFSREYPTPATLSTMLMSLGCRVEVLGGFPDRPRGFVSRMIGIIRSIAVRLHLIPGSMRGKEMLKKIFLGGTVPMPTRLIRDTAPTELLLPLSIDTATAPVKVFYLVATRPA
ncbi:hypothetical protein LBMAG53_15040 [Planctomycetota bacterium]|nr:hypothetical protein LBMAG53_15040 [Planctomycetota bacterium]